MKTSRTKVKFHEDTVFPVSSSSKVGPTMLGVVIILSYDIQMLLDVLYSKPCYFLLDVNKRKSALSLQFVVEVSSPDTPSQIFHCPEYSVPVDSFFNLSLFVVVSTSRLLSVTGRYHLQLQHLDTKLVRPIRNHECPFFTLFVLLLIICKHLFPVHRKSVYHKQHMDQEQVK